MTRHIRRLAALALIVAFGATAVADEGDAATYRKLLDQKSDSLVTVRFVQKMRFSIRGSAQERERNGSVNGAIVNADGLVMVTNLAVNPPVRMRGGPAGGVTFDAPTDIHVRFGNEEEEYEAVLAAVDSQLQLAFFRIKDLKDREVAPVAFDKTKKPEIGQELFLVHRLSRGFDYAPQFGSAIITGRIAQPRKAWCAIGSGAVGLPVFGLDGTALGVLMNQEADVGAGQGGSVLCVVPNDVIAATIKQAAEKAEEVLAKEAEGDADEADHPDDEGGSTDEPKDDGDGDDDGTGDGDGMGGGER